MVPRLNNYEGKKKWNTNIISTQAKPDPYLNRLAADYKNEGRDETSKDI